MNLNEFDHLILPDSILFFKQHRNDDPLKFRLKYEKNTALPIRAIAEQIDAYQRALTKFPSADIEDVLFTRKGIEQATSASVAKIHSNIIRGDQIADITSGLGFDSKYFSTHFKNVYAIEKDDLTAKIAAFNLNQYSNIEPIHDDSIHFLESIPNHSLDYIFVDPDRRVDDKRSFHIEDHQPNCLDHMSLFLTKAKKVALKLSPLADFNQMKNSFDTLSEFHVISVDNECKEVVCIMDQEKPKNVMLKTWMYSTKTNKLDLLESLDSDEFDKVLCAQINKYVIEPDRGIIKNRHSAVFAFHHKLSFINLNSDYMTHDKAINSNCRCYEVLCVLPYKIKIILQYLKKSQFKKVNISKRNFVEKVDTIRKKLKIKAGDDAHLHFTKDKYDKLICIITKRVTS